MEIIQNNLTTIFTGSFNDLQRKKVIFALKYYLARVCNTARNAEIIQLNHYIDDVYARKCQDNKRIILSPTQTPFPIAYFINFSVIKKEKSKFFYISSEGRLEIHPYEHIIPVLLALFSGDNLISRDKYDGKLFFACILLCGEISLRLINSKLLNHYDSMCVAVTVVVASVWGMKDEIVGFVLDNLLRPGGKSLDLQICLQSICAAVYQPNSFSSNYSPTEITKNILSVTWEKIMITDKCCFSGLDMLQFCLLGMDPMSSLLSAAVYSNCSSDLKITVHKNVWGTSVQNSNTVIDWDQNQTGITKILRRLERFISDNQINNGGEKLYGPKPLVIKKNVDEIKLELDEMTDENGNSFLKLSSKSMTEKNVSMTELASVLSGLCEYIESHIIWRLQSVIGVDPTRIVCQNLDEILFQRSLAKALSLVFERPALD